MVNRIQRDPRSRIMVVHLDRLAAYQGAARDEQPLGGSGGSSWIVVTGKEKESKTCRKTLKAQLQEKKER
jgi:hypothetical protein